MLQQSTDSQQSAPIHAPISKPSAYIWAVSGEADHCISFDSIGEPRITYRYRVKYERRFTPPITIGCIEFEPETGKWAIAGIGTTPIQPGEAFTYDSWEAAARWLYQQHVEQKRSRIRSAHSNG